MSLRKKVRNLEKGGCGGAEAARLKVRVQVQVGLEVGKWVGEGRAMEEISARRKERSTEAQISPDERYRQPVQPKHKIELEPARAQN